MLYLLNIKILFLSARFKWLHIYIVLSMVKVIFVPKLITLNIHVFIAQCFTLKQLHIYLMLHLWWLMISHSFFPTDFSVL
jgi:hypothetical protein